MRTDLALKNSGVGPTAPLLLAAVASGVHRQDARVLVIKPPAAAVVQRLAAGGLSYVLNFSELSVWGGAGGAPISSLEPPHID